MENSIEPLTTPVAFIIFNRPEKTARVFAEIRKAKPRQLFIIADGPRTEKERELTERTREVVAEIDWDCEVHRNYAEKNMSCRFRPPSGVAWVFEHADRAIFIEDDCLPDPTFFRFCQELLERYKDDERIMHIGGTNFMPHAKPFPESYFFSIAPDLWGWASWRRAWQKHYDIDLTLWPETKKRGLLTNVLPDYAVRERWEHRFDQYHAGKVDSWDGQWAFSCFINHGLSIVPSHNLVSNIGIDEQSTHSHSDNDPGSMIKLHSMEFPLIHPFAFVPNVEYDTYIWRTFHRISYTLRDRLRRFIKLHFPKGYGYLRSLGH